MNKLSFRFSVLLLLFQVVCFAQKNMHPGFIVTNDGDTVRGAIDQREWNQNPEAVNFSKDAKGDDIRKYFVRDIKAFAIDEIVGYERYSVGISMDKVGLDGNIHDGPFDPEIKVDTVFLKVLERGDVLTLFLYRDKLKPRFYVKGSGDRVPYELLYHYYTASRVVEGINQPRAVEKRVYRSQLLAIAERAGFRTATTAAKFKTISYASSDLIKTARLINGNQNKKRVKSKHPKGFDFYATTGYNFSSLSFLKSDFNPHSKPYSAPWFAMGVSFFPNNNVRKTMLQAELAYTTGNFISDGVSNLNQHVHDTFNQKNIALGINVNYPFYKSSNVQAMIGLGVKVCSSSYSNNVYTIRSVGNTASVDDFFSMSRLWIAGNIQATLLIRNKIGVMAAYVPEIDNLNKNGRVWNETLNSFRFGVTYVFLRK